MIDISGYNALEIPPELEKVVRDAIKQGLNGLKTARGGGRIDRMALRTAADRRRSCRCSALLLGCSLSGSITTRAK